MNVFQKLSRYYRECYTMGYYPTLLQLLDRHRLRLAYFGFLGDGNLGDELVFWSAKHLFPHCTIIPVRARTPIEFRILKSVLRNKLFHGVILGGGTLISSRDVPKHLLTLSQQHLPIFVHGTGVKDSHPNRNWKQILEGSGGGVRGPNSRKHLLPLADVAIAGDAAFALHPINRIELQSKSILINLGTHAQYRYAESHQVLEAMTETVRTLSNDGYTVRYLPMHSCDLDIAHQLKSRIASLEVLKPPRSYEELSSHFRSVEFAIGERLHFITAAAMSGCPFLSINYAAKHVDLLESIGLTKCGVSPSEFSQDLALSRIENFQNTNGLKQIEAYQAFQKAEAASFLEMISSPSKPSRFKTASAPSNSSPLAVPAEQPCGSNNQ